MKEKKLTIAPYLSFNGNCEEAINTYIEAFGGEIRRLLRWSESAYTVEPKQREKILHAEFILGNVRMAAGDSVDYIETAADIRLMIRLESKEEALRAIALLEKEGTVLSPLHEGSPLGDNSSEAIVTDRFGVTWIVTF